MFIGGCFCFLFKWRISIIFLVKKLELEVIVGGVGFVVGCIGYFRLGVGCLIVVM